MYAIFHFIKSGTYSETVSIDGKKNWSTTQKFMEGLALKKDEPWKF